LKQIPLQCNPKNVKAMGRMKKLLDTLIERRAKGDSFLETSTKFKLMLKGVDPDKITVNTPDDEKIIAIIYEIAQKVNIKLD